jgi:hypothetical protein
MKDLHDELRQMKCELDLVQRVYCSKEEEKRYRRMAKEKQPLPDDVRSDESGYFRYVETDLSGEELDKLLLYRQISYLRTTKNCMLFFMVLAVISLVISLVAVAR